MNRVKFYINSEDGQIYKAYLTSYTGDWNAIPIHFKNGNDNSIQFNENNIPQILTELTHENTLTLSHIKALISHSVVDGQSQITDDLLIKMLKSSEPTMKSLLFMHNKVAMNQYQVIALALDCTNGKEYNINVIYQRSDYPGGKIFSRDIIEFFEKFTFWKEY